MRREKIVNVLKYLTLLKPFQKLTWQQIHKRVFAVFLFLPFSNGSFNESQINEKRN